MGAINRLKVVPLRSESCIYRILVILVKWRDESQVLNKNQGNVAVSSIKQRTPWDLRSTLNREEERKKGQWVDPKPRLSPPLKASNCQKDPLPMGSSGVFIVESLNFQQLILGHGSSNT